MTETVARVTALRFACIAAAAALVGTAIEGASSPLAAQDEEATIPNLTGVWNGGARVRPINGPNQPWTPDNFPVLNERALAYQEVFDEALAPKYDCVPSSSPALQYDPYFMEVVQWPDRVLFRYEKDDQLRTVWLDGRDPPTNEYTIQGFSVGQYEADSLHVETTQFVFDITGFDDYNGIPSSQLKKVTETYWMDGDDLRIRLTVEDPMFLREPASYTTRWQRAPAGYLLNPYECDAEQARRSVRFMVPKYR